MPSGSTQQPRRGASAISPGSSEGILYPLMLDAIDEAICMFDCNGELIWQNKASLELCNQHPGAIHGKTGIQQQLTAAQLAGFRRELNRALSGESVQFDWICQHNTLRYQLQLRPLRDEVKVIAVMGTIREVAVSSTVSSPEQVVNLNQVFERVTDAFFALDKDWNYTYINQQAEALHGRPASELLGKNIWEEFPDVVTEPFYYSLQNAMRTQQPVRVELYYSGQQKWFEDYIYPSPEGVSVYYRDITVFKEKDEQLLRSEQQYRTLVEQAADAIIIADLQGHCLDANSMAEKMTGYTREELHGFNLYDLLVLPPGEPAPRMKEILDNRTVLQERKVRCKDGRTFYAELNTKRLPGDRLLIIARDITARKQTETAIRENELRWKLALDKSELGVWEMNFEKNTAFISEKTREQTGYLNETNLENPDFWLQAIAGEDKPVVLEKFVNTLKGKEPSFDATFRVICKSGEVKWFRFTGNVSGRDDNGRALRIIGVHEHLTDRISREKELQLKEAAMESTISGIGMADMYGTITYVNAAIVRMWGAGDKSQLIGKKLTDVFYGEGIYHTLELLRSADSASGEDLAIRVDGSVFPIEFNANLIRDKNGEPVCLFGSFIDISRRRQAQQKLKKSETLFREITQHSPSGIVLLDKKLRFAFASDSARRISGYQEDELIGEDPVNYTHPDDLPALMPRLLDLMQVPGKVITAVYRFLYKDGTWHTIESTFSNLLHIEHVEAVTINFRDITIQKLAEDKLNFEKNLSDSLIEKMPGIFYLYTREGRFLRWNKNLENISGYSAREIKRMHPFDFYDTDEREKIKKRINQLFHEKLPGIELQLLTKQKKKVPVYINSMAIMYEGEACVAGIATDISKLKKTQQELVESEVAFNRLFHESSEAILLLDGKKFIDCNDATVRLLGYTNREEFLFQPPWKLSPRRQPDGELSTVKAKRLINEALAKGYNRFEWMHLKADGTVFPVDVMLTPILVKGHQLFYTIWRDITDRKKAEAALQQSIREISDYKYAIDQSTIVSFSDPSGNITYVNDNFVKLYGYAKEEIIGVNHRILNSKQHDDNFWKDFWSHINKGKVLRAEVCNKSKDGQLHWADTTIVPFLDETGKPYQYLAIRSDITEKKRLEDELSEQQRLEQIHITETALDAQEKERNFLGQELHDNVNQILVGTKLLLSVVAEDPVRHREVLDNSILNIEHAIQENRKLSHSLATPDLKLLSLPKQLHGLAREMFYQQPVKVKFSSKGFRDELLDEKRKITLYRIAQEQCTNIIKYAQASEVRLTLSFKRQQAILIISDNGRGMDPGKTTDGIGIRNMKGRLSIYGGTIDILTFPGEGFTLTVSMPL